MAKKRKTREQKIIAELRRKLILRQTPAFTPSTPLRVSSGKQDESPRQTSTPTEVSTDRHGEFHHLPPPLEESREGIFKILPQVEKKSIATYLSGDYSYLTGDLKRVGILTGLAILAQGVLYLALR